jgi:hypothetical protein
LRRKPQDAAMRREYSDLLSGDVDDGQHRARAIEETRKLVASDPSPETHHKLARLLAGDPTHVDEAVGEYRTLLNADPANPLWRDEYRQLLLSDDRYRSDAVKEYRRLAEERPDDLGAKHTLAGSSPARIRTARRRSPSPPTSSSSNPPTPRCVSNTPISWRASATQSRCSSSGSMKARSRRRSRCPGVGRTATRSPGGITRRPIGLSFLRIGARLVSSRQMV